jgi:hypothetical protein
MTLAKLLRRWQGDPMQRNDLLGLGEGGPFSHYHTVDLCPLRLRGYHHRKWQSEGFDELSPQVLAKRARVPRKCLLPQTS